MQCARLNHFARLNNRGTISRCGHMVNAPGFKSVEEMDNSQWLDETIKTLETDNWPKECTRCQSAENIGIKSIRQYSNDFHEQEFITNNNYLVIGGVLDNICNSACQSCSSRLSTKIGSLESKDYIKINNESLFASLPQDRIIKLDINGGEPTASPAYQHLLENLPINVKYIRVNTNGSRLLPNLQNIINRGIHVTVTVSLDGIGKIHDYVRWPIKWETVSKTIELYKTYPIELNTWTTVHALNIGDLKNIIAYTEEYNIDHGWALLETPDVLKIKYSNHLTKSADVPDQLKNILNTGIDNTLELQRFITVQDQLRGINFKNFY